MGIRINDMAEDDPLFEIRDRAVVIAGAGGGLGGETARALHGRGARLILFDIDEARLRAVEADMLWANLTPILRQPIRACSAAIR
jgi:NAD(P)-dependent dehydrogenase (short-subunit alcohol dehydrogenase family)